MLWDGVSPILERPPGRKFRSGQALVPAARLRCGCRLRESEAPEARNLSLACGEGSGSPQLIANVVSKIPKFGCSDDGAREVARARQLRGCALEQGSYCCGVARIEQRVILVLGRLGNLLLVLPVRSSLRRDPVLVHLVVVRLKLRVELRRHCRKVA